MKQNFLIVIFSLISNFVISQNTLVEIIEYYPNGTIYGKGSKRYFQKQGEWIYYDLNGKIIEKAKYENGNKYFWSKWENGKQVVYKGNGIVREYYYNGSLKATGKVKEGKKHGLWKEYFINGLTKSELDYKYWASPCRNNISSNCIVKTSFDNRRKQICKNGFGFYEYINDSGVIYQIDFLTNNGKDSIYYFYPNQKLKEIKFINRNHYDIAETLKEFYPNEKIKYEVIKSKDTIYFINYSDEGIKVSERIKFLDKEVKFTFNKIGKLIKEQHCTHTQRINTETGFEEILVGCDQEIKYEEQ